MAYAEKASIKGEIGKIEAGREGRERIFGKKKKWESYETDLLKKFKFVGLLHFLSDQDSALSHDLNFKIWVITID